MKFREETHYWIELLFKDEYREWDDFDEYPAWFDWYDSGCPGYISNMDEYHQMYLLTLLRKFNIKTAKELAKNRGW